MNKQLTQENSDTSGWDVLNFINTTVLQNDDKRLGGHPTFLGFHIVLL